jgi:hypothetical protein
LLHRDLPADHLLIVRRRSQHRSFSDIILILILILKLCSPIYIYIFVFDHDCILCFSYGWPPFGHHQVSSGLFGRATTSAAKSDNARKAMLVAAGLSLAVVTLQQREVNDRLE